MFEDIIAAALTVKTQGREGDLIIVKILASLFHTTKCHLLALRVAA